MGLLEITETKAYFLFNTLLIIPITMLLVAHNGWWILGLMFQVAWTLHALGKHWKD